MNMQTIFPIFAVAVMAWVALIWAIVIIVTVRNVIVAVKSRGQGEDGTTTAPTTTPTDMPTIAGMPIGAYYATHATQMTTPTNTFNNTTTTIIH